MVRDAAAFRVTSLDEAGPGGDLSVADRVADGQPSIIDRLHAEDLQAQVALAIAGLPERERLVMVLYYDEELNLREIGQVIGVTESRVCQIHGQALLRLKARLAEELPPRVVR
jgi:RNA polymerase sigma factor for flagellar operon FliA